MPSKKATCQHKSQKQKEKANKGNKGTKYAETKQANKQSFLRLRYGFMGFK